MAEQKILARMTLYGNLEDAAAMQTGLSETP